MPENWAPCRNCPHPPDVHQAVILRPIAIDPPARAVFEGTLGACLAKGCGCDLWTRQALSPRELARESREVPDDCELVAVPDKDWQLDRTRTCRYGGNKPCGRRSAATMERGFKVRQRWGYCEDHMFGRWVEGGVVLNWILREKGRTGG